MLGPAPGGFADGAPLDLLRLPVILNDETLADGRHLVLGDADGLHRLWLSDPRPDQALAYVVVRDASVALRQAVAIRFDRRMSGVAPGRLPPGLYPTPFQRQRLQLLVDILDLLDRQGRERPTTYAIARLRIYPHMTIKRGMEWKSSSERRRTQRLVEEALSLRDGGYRALLRGEMTGRQKATTPFSRSP